MAVVISGTNNSDKITATDGLIDLLSSVNFASEVSVPSFKVGSDIQFGNAGIITATTLVGNLQGNINHTSNLLLQISGSEKFRVGTSGQLGIGGANYGTSGQVLTSGGSGSAASWTTITGTTINSNADNRIITGSGTANTLNGESNLTFDGTNLTIVSPDISVGTGATISSLGNVTAGIATFAGGVTFKGSNGTLHWRMKPSGSFEPQFNNFFNIGDTYYNVNNVYTKNLVLSEDIIHNLDTNTKIRFPAADQISFETGGTNRLKIHTYDSNHNVEVDASAHLSLANNGSNGRFIYIGDANASSTGYMHLQPGGGSQGFGGGIRLYSHSNSTNPGGVYIGKSHASSGAIIFGNGGMSPLNEYARIDSGGRMGLGTNSPSSYNNKAYNFVISSSSHAGMTIAGGTSSDSSIYFADGTSGAAQYAGWIQYEHDNNALTFGVNESERLRIGSDGQINVAGILTATSVQQRTSKFYGVTTTERNALSPSEGDIIYNTTDNTHEFYNASNNWTPILSALPPTFTTNSGNIGTLYNASLSNGDWSIAAIQATSNSGNINFTVTSGSLPTGMSMSSDGAFSGTVSGVGGDTTYTFTVSATNPAGTSTRQFNIVVKAEVTQNYSFTGSTVTWSRPTNVKYVAFRMWGGAGTHGRCTSNNHYPGRGGKTEGTINVSSHSSLYLQVGEAGKAYSNEPNAGWPNGGEGNNEHSCQGAGGGGSSNIYNSSGTGSYSNVIAVAGGGGSVSHGNPNSNGGDGGGTNGGSSNRGGSGGSQNAGGSQGSTPCGNTGNAGAGTQMQGGDAGGGSGCTNAGAGGGGGWYGGGAGGNSNGGNSYGGGGGGSGYYDTNLVSGGSTKQASESGWSTNKPSGIADRASYGDNNRGGHGYISLRY